MFVSILALLVSVASFTNQPETEYLRDPEFFAELKAMGMVFDEKQLADFLQNPTAGLFANLEDDSISLLMSFDKLENESICNIEIDFLHYDKEKFLDLVLEDGTKACPTCHEAMERTFTLLEHMGSFEKKMAKLKIA